MKILCQVYINGLGVINLEQMDKSEERVIKEDTLDDDIKESEYTNLCK